MIRDQLGQRRAGPARLSWQEPDGVAGGILGSRPQVPADMSVRAWPTYVVIDDEGIIRFRSTGTGEAEQSRLEDAIKRQLKIVAARQKANAVLNGSACRSRSNNPRALQPV